MGVYLNPGTRLFSIAVNSLIYVDKTTMIDETNASVNTENRYICVSRPRRFGKSMAVSMLSAYYGAGDDSRLLFEKLKLAQSPEWDKYLGKFDVIHLVMTDFINASTTVDNAIKRIASRVREELHDAYPDVRYDDDFIYSLSRFSQSSKRQFVIVMDEWDCVFRERPEDLNG